MEIFLSFILGVITGVYLLKKYARYRLKQLSKVLEEKIQETIQEKIVNIKFEKADDIVYAYNEKDNSFLTQGTTKDEIIDNLTKRFPDTSFNANRDNMKEVGLME